MSDTIRTSLCLLSPQSRSSPFSQEKLSLLIRILSIRWRLPTDQIRRILFLDLRLDSEEHRYIYSEYWLKTLAEAINNEDFVRMAASLAMLGAGIASLVTDSYQVHATDFTLEDHLSDPEKRFCILLYGQGTSGERIFFHLKPDWASLTAYCLSFPSDGNRGVLFRAAFARLFEYRVMSFPQNSPHPSLYRAF